MPVIRPASRGADGSQRAKGRSPEPLHASSISKSRDFNIKMCLLCNLDVYSTSNNIQNLLFES